MNFDNMNKGALRSACMERGLPIDGQSVEQMRDALKSHEAGKIVADSGTAQAETETGTEQAPTEVVADVVQEPAVEPAPVEAEVSAEPVPEAPVAAPIVQEVAPPVSAVVVPLPAPIMPAPRAESNGVKQPAPGTICRQIWDHCDATLAAGQMPQAKQLRAWGAGRLDDVTMTVQFYRWRKFMGISGRQA